MGSQTGCPRTCRANTRTVKAARLIDTGLGSPASMPSTPYCLITTFKSTARKGGAGVAATFSTQEAEEDEATAGTSRKEEATLDHHEPKVLLHGSQNTPVKH